MTIACAYYCVSLKLLYL